MNTRRLWTSLLVIPLLISAGKAQGTESGDASVPARIVALQPLLQNAASGDTQMPTPPGLDGYRLRNPIDGAIYLIMFSHRRHIPGPATYNNLFKSSCVSYDTPLVEWIDEERPLNVGARLLIARSSKAVYLFTDGLKYHVSNPIVLDRYCFDINKASPVDDELLAFIPDGKPLI